MVDVAVDGLMQELRLSPAVCELIRQQHGAVTHNSPVLPVGGEQCEPPYISSEVLQLTTQTLFKHCQQKTCMSSDTWLAIQSLSEKNPVLLQVHRCILAARCAFFQVLFSTTWTEASSDHITVSTEECSGELAAAVIGYLYTGLIEADASTAAEIISLANLWQLPGLIQLVSHQLTVGSCQSFRRPTSPTDSLVSNVPAMAAFSKAALEGGIEHDSVQRLYQSCVGWLAKHSLLAWPTKAFAQLPARIHNEVRAKAKAMLNAVNALPQLEQADKLTARMPPAKWAADMHIAAKAWRGEVLQYIAEGFPKVALTSAFLERLQSEWTLEHLQQIAEAVKVEYGASRGGYALEVYLALQRIQNSAENGSFSEAEDVKALLDGLQDHCWSYILRNWHLLQRTPTYKVSIPPDQRQRLAADVKQSLSHITTLDSPGDQSRSMGFSVLWDASNTKLAAAAGLALTPDGKRPVSKATEKRRQRLAEEQEQRRQEEEKRMLQQRRQRTVREIRERQAAVAAEAAGRAAPGFAVQCEAENDPSKRAVQDPRQGGVGQRAAGGQPPVPARAGPRRSSEASLAQSALPGAAASCKPASKTDGKVAGGTRPSGKQPHADGRPGLMSGAPSSPSVQTAQRSSRLSACLEGGQQANRQTKSTLRSAGQHKPAAASGMHTSHHVSQPAGHPSRPTSEAHRQQGGQQQRPPLD
ncbi:hypothetical protein ABBQ38_009122 [Trebouxia sp. C0009 RCD-2024]